MGCSPSKDEDPAVAKRKELDAKIATLPRQAQKTRIFKSTFTVRMYTECLASPFSTTVIKVSTGDRVVILQT